MADRDQDWADKEQAFGGGLQVGSFAVRSPLEIVFITRDVGLLPIAEGDLEDAHGTGTGIAGKSVLLVCGNPDLIAGAAFLHAGANLHDSPVIEHDPQLCPARVRLQAEPLTRKNGHQAHRAILIERVLFEGSPRTLDEGDGRFLRRNGFGDVVAHSE